MAPPLTRFDLRQMLMMRGGGRPLNATLQTTWTDNSVDWERVNVASYFDEDVGSTQEVIPMLVARPSTTRKEKLPVVIFSHGTGKGKSDPSLTRHMERYAKSFDTACVSFDSRYHGETRGGVDDDEEDRATRVAPYVDRLIDVWRDDDLSSERPFIFDSAVDALRVVDYVQTRPDFDGTKVGATGISLGGMITWFAAAADDRIAVAAPAIGVQHFRYAYENDAFVGRVESVQKLFDAAKVDVGKSEVDAELFKLVLDKITPGLLDTYDAPRSLPLIAPRPLLVVNGELDHRCPIAAVADLYLDLLHGSAYREAPSNLGLYIGRGVKHQVTDDMWGAIDRWFQRFLFVDDDPTLTVTTTLEEEPPGGDSHQDSPFCPASDASFLRDPHETDLATHRNQSLAYLRSFDFWEKGGEQTTNYS